MPAQVKTASDAILQSAVVTLVSLSLSLSEMHTSQQDIGGKNKAF